MYFSFILFIPFYPGNFFQSFFRGVHFIFHWHVVVFFCWFVWLYCWFLNLNYCGLNLFNKQKATCDSFGMNLLVFMNGPWLLKLLKLECWDKSRLSPLPRPVPSFKPLTLEVQDEFPVACAHLIIRLQKPPPYINGDRLERVQSSTFLRAKISADLTWTIHTRTVIKKPPQLLDFLRGLWKTSPKLLDRIASQCGLPAALKQNGWGSRRWSRRCSGSSAALSPPWKTSTWDAAIEEHHQRQHSSCLPSVWRTALLQVVQIHSNQDKETKKQLLYTGSYPTGHTQTKTTHYFTLTCVKYGNMQ